MIHANRVWINDHIIDLEEIFLEYDIINIFNETIPHKFLENAANYAPASLPFTKYYYAQPINLIYHG